MKSAYTSSQDVGLMGWLWGRWRVLAGLLCEFVRTTWWELIEWKESCSAFGSPAAKREDPLIAVVALDATKATHAHVGCSFVPTSRALVVMEGIEGELVLWPSFTLSVHGRFKFNFHQEANSMTETGPFSSTLLSRFRSVSSRLFPAYRLGLLSSIRVRFFLLFFFLGRPGVRMLSPHSLSGMHWFCQI